MRFFVCFATFKNSLKLDPIIKNERSLIYFFSLLEKLSSINSLLSIIVRECYFN